MDLRLRGKNVLVTGGSKRIGLACAAGFAAEGCNLHLVARNEADLEQVRLKLAGEHGVQVTCHAHDLAEVGTALALSRACLNVDVLVNCAGSIPHGRMDELGEADWRRGWDVKVFGYINLAREFYREMKQRKSGVIINIIGLGGAQPRAKSVAGSSGNAALMAFSQALGAESVNYGVRVVGVNPANVESDRHVARYEKEADKRWNTPSRWKEVREEMAKALPFGRFAQAHEIADLVVFLASDRASYISGTIVTIDGGHSYRPWTEAP